MFHFLWGSYNTISFPSNKFSLVSEPFWGEYTYYSECSEETKCQIGESETRTQRGYRNGGCPTELFERKDRMKEASGPHIEKRRGFILWDEKPEGLQDHFSVQGLLGKYSCPLCPWIEVTCMSLKVTDAWKVSIASLAIGYSDVIIVYCAIIGKDHKRTKAHIIEHFMGDTLCWALRGSQMLPFNRM